MPQIRGQRATDARPAMYRQRRGGGGDHGQVRPFRPRWRDGRPRRCSCSTRCRRTLTPRPHVASVDVIWTRRSRQGGNIGDLGKRRWTDRKTVLISITYDQTPLWLVEALTRAGRTDRRMLHRARMMFEEMLGYANHLGLYAEETGRNGEAWSASSAPVSACQPRVPPQAAVATVTSPVRCTSSRSRWS